MSEQTLEAMKKVLSYSGLSPEDKVILPTRLAAIQLIDMDVESISFSHGEHMVELKVIKNGEGWEQLQKSNDFIFGLSRSGDSF